MECLIFAVLRYQSFPHGHVFAISVAPVVVTVGKLKHEAQDLVWFVPLT